MSATSRAGPSFRQITIIGLTLATAAVHVAVGLSDPEITLLFGLNGLGYLGLLGLLYLPLEPLRPWRGLVRWTLMSYAALTMLLWVVWVVMSGEATAAGVVTKLIELGLIGLLWGGAE